MINSRRLEQYDVPPPAPSPPPPLAPLPSSTINFVASASATVIYDFSVEPSSTTSAALAWTDTGPGPVQATSTQSVFYSRSHVSLLTSDSYLCTSGLQPSYSAQPGQGNTVALWVYLGYQTDVTDLLNLFVLEDVTADSSWRSDRPNVFMSVANRSVAYFFYVTGGPLWVHSTDASEATSAGVSSILGNAQAILAPNSNGSPWTHLVFTWPATSFGTQYNSFYVNGQRQVYTSWSVGASATGVFSSQNAALCIGAVTLGSFVLKAPATTCARRPDCLMSQPRLPCCLRTQYDQPTLACWIYLCQQSVQSLASSAKFSLYEGMFLK